MTALHADRITDRDRWDALMTALPNAHLLQSWQWGDFKRDTTGWQPDRVLLRDDHGVIALISIGIRRAAGVRVAYAPKGPILNPARPDALALTLAWLEAEARRQRFVWLKIDPDIARATGVPDDPDQPQTDSAAGVAVESVLKARGWRLSDDQVQFRNTIVIDPQRDDAALLASFNQSTRRKLRTAEKAGVTVRMGDRADLPLLYDLYRTTAQRDSFLIRPFDYYRLAWERFIDAGIAQPLIAMRDGQAIAHVILFRYGTTCWYIYGASSDDQREAMPNYLLQWQAIRWARDHGCTAYDLWGAPDVFTAEDRLWGVYTFKRGFRGVVTQHIGAWDYAPNAIVYRAYTVVMPRVIAFMRARAGAAND